MYDFFRPHDEKKMRYAQKIFISYYPILAINYYISYYIYLLFTLLISHLLFPLRKQDAPNNIPITPKYLFLFFQGCPHSQPRTQLYQKKMVTCTLTLVSCPFFSCLCVNSLTYIQYVRSLLFVYILEPT